VNSRVYSGGDERDRDCRSVSLDEKKKNESQREELHSWPVGSFPSRWKRIKQGPCRIAMMASACKEPSRHEIASMTCSLPAAYESFRLVILDSAVPRRLRSAAKCERESDRRWTDAPGFRFIEVRIVLLNLTGGHSRTQYLRCKAARLITGVFPAAKTTIRRKLRQYHKYPRSVKDVVND